MLPLCRVEYWCLLLLAKPLVCSAFSRTVYSIDAQNVNTVCRFSVVRVSVRYPYFSIFKYVMCIKLICIACSLFLLIYFCLSRYSRFYTSLLSNLVGRNCGYVIAALVSLASRCNCHSKNTFNCECNL